MKFTIEKKIEGTLARAGIIETKNGVIQTIIASKNGV
jgi:hypothetical protein